MVQDLARRERMPSTRPRPWNSHANGSNGLTAGPDRRTPGLPGGEHGAAGLSSFSCAPFRTHVSNPTLHLYIKSLSRS